GDDDMSMPVHVPERSEALRDADRTGVTTGDAELPCTAAMVGEYDANEAGEHGSCELAIAQQTKPQPVRERQRPLPVGGLGSKHTVDEVTRGLGHAPAVARGAQTSRFARPGYEHLELARRALHAGETPLEPAAVEIASRPAHGRDAAQVHVAWT